MISELLKQLMARKGLKQTDLAEVLEVSLSRVKAMTSGRVKNLTSREIELLAGKLDIRTRWLISGEGPMDEDDESDDEFANRQLALNQMNALIDALPLSDFTKMRLGALITGDPAKDGALIGEAVRKEMLGIDFVTGQPVAVAAALPPRVAALVSNYEHATEEGKRVIEGTASLAAESKVHGKAA